MKLLFTILFYSFSLIFYSQSIKQSQLEGAWEVVRIDDKIFKGGVITYFEFTEDQLLYAMSKNGEDHGILKNKILIGNYSINNNNLIIHEADSTKKTITYKISFIENEQNILLLVLEEIDKYSQNIRQISYLKKWGTQ